MNVSTLGDREMFFVHSNVKSYSITIYKLQPWGTLWYQCFLAYKVFINNFNINYASVFLSFCVISNMDTKNFSNKSDDSRYGKH